MKGGGGGHPQQAITPARADTKAQNSVATQIWSLN